jgi:type III secretory pathway lipoprotein EscJ
MRPVRALLAAFFVSTVAGCTVETLHRGLEEGDANDMVALLRRRGVDARKVADGDSGAFAVAVPKESFPEAVRATRAWLSRTLRALTPLLSWVDLACARDRVLI